jgi:hypothetical protein
VGLVWNDEKENFLPQVLANVEIPTLASELFVTLYITRAVGRESIGKPFLGDGDFGNGGNGRVLSFLTFGRRPSESHKMNLHHFYVPNSTASADPAPALF